MSEIQITAILKIKNGKLDEFKAIAEACMKIVREKDTKTLQYDWFFNENQNECIIREMYVDSDAVLEHMGNLGETLGQLLSVADLGLEVYGQPSDQLLKAMEGLDIEYYSLFQKL